jgi:carbon storage regulator
MLVLSRYRDESIFVGDDIVITVVDIRGDRVRIGVQAPSDVTVHRQEVYDAIKNGSHRESSAGSRPKEAVPSAPKPVVAPLKEELSKRKVKISTSSEAKVPPVTIEQPVEFGGLTSDNSILPQ